jgi:hypothetical protein
MGLLRFFCKQNNRDWYMYSWDLFGFGEQAGATMAENKIPVKVKWVKEKYDVELMLDEPVEVFKTQVLIPCFLMACQSTILQSHCARVVFFGGWLVLAS